MWQVDPCAMLLYLHFVHYMVVFSREAELHLQRPMSTQEVDIHYFLANPELQTPLVRVPYYGIEMMKKLHEIEALVFKSRNWDKSYFYGTAQATRTAF